MKTKATAKTKKPQVHVGDLKPRKEAKGGVKKHIANVKYEEAP